MDDFKNRGSSRPRTSFFDVPSRDRSGPVRSSNRLSSRSSFFDPAAKSIPENSNSTTEPRQTTKHPNPNNDQDSVIPPEKIMLDDEAAIKPEPKRRGKKRIFFIFFLALLLIGVAIYWFVIKKDKPNQPAANEQSAQQTQEQQQPQTLSGNFRIIATGDIITHDSVNQAAKNSSGYDFSPMLSEVKPVLEKAQTRICHNTVPASGGSISGYPSFNAPTELISDLSGSGCNVMSLASDHINDKGQGAIDKTVDLVKKDKNIVISAGANKSAEDQKADVIFNVGNGQVKFGYLSYTTHQNNSSSKPYGVNVYNKKTAVDQVKTLKQKTDFVIVSVCWGKEDSGDIQPEQDAIAQDLTDAGADLVLGHCTHVVQPVKKLKSRDDSTHESIVYLSLGNTLNSELPLETLIGGMAVVNMDLSTKKVTEFGFYPTYMHYEWSAADKQNSNFLARKNLKLYPLDKAEKPLASSQNKTTVTEQKSKLGKTLNQFTTLKIYSTEELLK